jgi:hypothetical protein
MAYPLHRHQTSLESVINFAITAASLSTNERDQATSTFDRIIKHCSTHESLKAPGDAGRRYGRAKLVKLVYDHAISDAGRDNVLRYFLTSMMIESMEMEVKQFSRVLTSLAGFDDWDVPMKESIMERVRNFADHLVDGFFLPCTCPSSKHI